ncbi:MAG: SufD family Fe-S cluster assembly protein [Bacteroidia bacterium]|nr:SufD family Fe-S cluster assembly protein [Bacteroidia bacterium]MDW8015619.1 SufD family Fe-S cluster assembly protein [Bacteroidia bacterium]
MESIVQEQLSLEEGAAHLTQILRESRDEQILPVLLRQHVSLQAQQAELGRIFTDQSLKEDWKYTPLDFLRRRWQVKPFEEVSPPFSFLEDWRREIVPIPLHEETPALRSFPEPRSPWEALAVGAPTHRHYTLKRDERLSLAFRNSGELAPLTCTISVSPLADCEVWLCLSGTGFSLLRLHFHVGREGRLRLYIPDRLENQSVYHYFLVTGYLEEYATVETYDLTIASGWKRSEIRLQLGGTGARAYLHGAAHVLSAGMMDAAIRVEHLAPHTESNQLFRSLVEAKGRSTFQGRIYVHRLAQKTNAYQSHKALLTAASAVAYSRPQLEIFADDVRCTHGVTTGFLQGEMLFYLRARGIPEGLAKQMLYEAFLTEVIEKVPSPSLQSWASEEIRRNIQS